MLLAEEKKYLEAETHLAKSLSLLEGIGAKYDLARVSLAVGRVRMGRRDWEGASAMFGQAASLASRCALREVETEAAERLREIETARARDADIPGKG